LIIEGTRISVDDFHGKASAFILSHYHADHRSGLGSGWSRGDLYASGATCGLVQHMDGVAPERLHALEAGESVTIDDPEAGAVTVAAIDANHCPGALMLHFSVKGASVLYTGDFRLNDAMRERVAGLAPVDLLYVDGTYAETAGRFPPQEEAIDKVVRLAERNADKDILLAVYTLGKNRVLEAVSRRLGKPVYLPARTLKVYRLLGYGEFVTGDRKATNIRGYMRGYFESYYKMQRSYHDGSAVVIIPTGWAVDDGDRFERDKRYHYVAYSEHCDATERAEFIGIVKPARIVDIT